MSTVTLKKPISHFLIIILQWHFGVFPGHGLPDYLGFKKIKFFHGEDVSFTNTWREEYLSLFSSSFKTCLVKVALPAAWLPLTAFQVKICMKGGHTIQGDCNCILWHIISTDVPHKLLETMSHYALHCLKLIWSVLKACKNTHSNPQKP